jgi:hypothetical protein
MSTCEEADHRKAERSVFGTVAVISQPVRGKGSDHASF